MSVYTRQGDSGKTSIFKKSAGKSIRLLKSDPLIDAIGSIDEANSYLGICISVCNTLKLKSRGDKEKISEDLIEIQRNLFTIGAMLAGAEMGWKEKSTVILERKIDIMENDLSKLTGFILPGGSELSAHLMYVRTLLRKAERKIVKLFQSKSKNKPKKTVIENILPYINRLSDYIFVLARWVNWKSKIREVKWTKSE